MLTVNRTERLVEMDESIAHMSRLAIGSIAELGSSRMRIGGLPVLVSLALWYLAM